MFGQRKRSHRRASALVVVALLAATAPAVALQPNAAEAMTTLSPPAAASAPRHAGPKSPRPKVTSLSAHSSSVVGGTSVTIRGTGFGSGSRVNFGSLRALKVKRLSSQRLIATAPPSWPQNTFVTVSSRGLTSSPNPAARFRYKAPHARTSLRAKPSRGTLVLGASQVASVTSDPATPGASGGTWTATLNPGVSPRVGRAVYLPPGSAAYPPGFAGTISAVAATAAGGNLMTVKSTPLSDVLSSVSVQASGLPAGAGMRERAVPPAAARGVAYTNIAGSAWECTNKLTGKDFTPNISVNMDFTDLNPYFELDQGGLFRHPFVAFWVSYQREISVTGSISAAADCKLSAAYQNINKRVLVWPNGVTLTFGPATELSFSASGSVSVSQHSYHMNGFITNPDGTLKKLDGQSADPWETTFSGEIKVDARVGSQIQVGFLDRIGIGVEVGVGASASAAVKTPPLQLCVSVDGFLYATIYAYLDTWVKKWTYQFADIRVILKRYAPPCVTTAGDTASGGTSGGAGGSTGGTGGTGGGTGGGGGASSGPPAPLFPVGPAGYMTEITGDVSCDPAPPGYQLAYEGISTLGGGPWATGESYDPQSSEYFPFGGTPADVTGPTTASGDCRYMGNQAYVSGTYSAPGVTTTTPPVLGLEGTLAPGATVTITGGSVSCGPPAQAVVPVVTVGYAPEYSQAPPAGDAVVHADGTWSQQFTIPQAWASGQYVGVSAFCMPYDPRLILARVPWEFPYPLLWQQLQ